MKKFNIYYYDRYGIPRVDICAAKSESVAVAKWCEKNGDKNQFVIAQKA